MKWQKYERMNKQKKLDMLNKSSFFITNNFTDASGVLLTPYHNRDAFTNLDNIWIVFN